MTDQHPPIEAEVVPPQAVAVRQAGAVGKALTIEELHQRLEYVREVMRKEMKKGQDFGQIPGCGDKPTLLQPGAQKLLMTFNLCEFVKKEELRELRNDHREYSFTICVKRGDGAEWDGVGTCSTLEAKYRYRQSGRRCPNCGQATILKSKQGSGFFCWAKKGGCGTNFRGDDQRIVSQSEARVEHDNPADYWNTVRKMAFKRALVAAAINATNTSELWTQDIEDTADPDPPAPADNAPAKPPGRAEPKTPPSTPTPAVKTPPAATSERGIALKPPTEATRKWMLDELHAAGLFDLAQEYFTKLNNPMPLMPGEPLTSLRLIFVPNTRDELKMLVTRVEQFARGDRAEPPFAWHWEAEGKQAIPAKAALPTEHPKDPLWWRNVIVTVPRKGMKRDEYLKHPDTIGSLYDARHKQDEESEYMRQRLWGLIEKWKPEPRTVGGKTYQPTEGDKKFYEALMAFDQWFKDNHRGEKI